MDVRGADRAQRAARTRAAAGAADLPSRPSAGSGDRAALAAAVSGRSSGAARPVVRGRAGGPRRGRPSCRSGRREQEAEAGQNQAEVGSRRLRRRAGCRFAGAGAAPARARGASAGPVCGTRDGWPRRAGPPEGLPTAAREPAARAAAREPNRPRRTARRASRRPPRRASWRGAWCGLGERSRRRPRRRTDGNRWPGGEDAAAPAGEGSGAGRGRRGGCPRHERRSEGGAAALDGRPLVPADPSRWPAATRCPWRTDTEARCR